VRRRKRENRVGHSINPCRGVLPQRRRGAMAGRVSVRRAGTKGGNSTHTVNKPRCAPAIGPFGRGKLWIYSVCWLGRANTTTTTTRARAELGLPISKGAVEQLHLDLKLVLGGRQRVRSLWRATRRESVKDHTSTAPLAPGDDGGQEGGVIEMRRDLSVAQRTWRRAEASGWSRLWMSAAANMGCRRLSRTRDRTKCST
jgi:hypothetical protein